MRLTEQDRTFIATRVAALETRTGTQVVTAVVAKSDSYPEVPWKAFALGSASAAMAVAAWEWFADPWSEAHSSLLHVLVILGSGALFALASVLSPRLARLFIDRARRDAEATQFAQGLFFRHGLDRTRGRVGILLLVSLFERKVVLLADAGFEGRIDPPHWHALTHRLTYVMRHRGTTAALRAGLDALEAILLIHGFAGDDNDNIFPDAVLELTEGI